MELKKILKKISDNQKNEEVKWIYLILKLNNDFIKQVTEIILDNKYIKNELSEEDKALLLEYKEVRVFAMNACKLTSLKNFPAFKELEIVNKIFHL